MSEMTLDRARAGDEQAFRDLTDPYRRELHVHCYRILGSLQDAEDLLQETLLAAWRGLDGFEERASLRAWLYRIATNRCLNAVRDSGRRPQEVTMRLSELPEPSRIGEVTWLEPYPDSLLDEIADAGPGPEARYEAKEAIALSFIAALQHLPPRQRAVLVLREVLGFSAAEVAAMLESTEASVTSALQRARGTIEALPGSVAVAARERAPSVRSPRERELVDRFVEAFEGDDIDAVVALLTEDALLAMPPEPWEYVGPDAIARFLLDRTHRRTGGRIRLVPTGANGQPAFGFYVDDRHTPISRCVGLLVLTIEGDRIAGITRFAGNAVLRYFGLPRTLQR